MKRTIQGAAICGTTMSVLNILDQLFFNPKEKFDFEELFKVAALGTGIGATTGAALDIIEYLSENCEESECTLLDKIWDKGEQVWWANPDEWRLDKYGNWIKRSDYGNRKSDYGWEKDHSKPRAKNGKDHLNNFQPLQWEENVRKGDKYPYKK